MTPLLHGDRVRPLSEHFADLCQVAVLSHLVLDLRRVVDEGELRGLALYHLCRHRSKREFAIRYCSREKLHFLKRFLCLDSLRGFFVFRNLLETFRGALDGTDLTNRLQDVAVLFLDRVVPYTVLHLVTRAVQCYLLPYSVNKNRDDRIS